MSLVQGSQSLGSGVDTASVVYDTAFSSTPEVILVTVENTSADVTKLAITATVTASSTTGFTVGLSQTTNSANYNLVWYVSDTGTTTDLVQLALKGRRVSDLNVLNTLSDDDYFPMVKSYPTPHAKRVKWGRMKTAFQQYITDTLLTPLPGLLLDTEAAPADEVGLIRWNDTDKCIEYVTVNGTVIQIGQEMGTYARNSTGVNIPNGTVVYVSGATGNRPTIVKAQANSFPSAEKTIGLVTGDAGIDNNHDGFITTFGLVRGLDTSGYAEGQEILLSPTVAGGLTTTVPTDESHYVVSLGVVTRVSPSQGEILVRPHYMGSVTGYALMNSVSKAAAREAVAAETEFDFRGLWDAETNTPTLVDGTGTIGDTYFVRGSFNQTFSVDLGSGSKTFTGARFVEYDGAEWQPLTSPEQASVTLTRMQYLPSTTDTYVASLAPQYWSSYPSFLAVSTTGIAEGFPENDGVVFNVGGPFQRLQLFQGIYDSGNPSTAPGGLYYRTNQFGNQNAWEDWMRLGDSDTAVLLTGVQTVAGEKTFSGPELKVKTGLPGEGYAVLRSSVTPSLRFYNELDVIVAQIIASMSNGSLYMDYSASKGGGFVVRKEPNSNSDTVFAILSNGQVVVYNDLLTNLDNVNSIGSESVKWLEAFISTVFTSKLRALSGESLLLADEDNNTQAWADTSGFSSVKPTVVATGSATLTRQPGVYVKQKTTPGFTTTLWTTPTEGDTATIMNRTGGSTTVAGNGETIEGSASVTLFNEESINLVYIDGEWSMN